MRKSGTHLIKNLSFRSQIVHFLLKLYDDMKISVVIMISNIEKNLGNQISHVIKLLIKLSIVHIFTNPHNSTKYLHHKF